MAEVTVKEALEGAKTVEEALEEAGIPLSLLPEWEYHRLKTPDRQPITSSVLNAQGKEGWELVSVLHVNGEINYIFKRIKP